MQFQSNENVSGFYICPCPFRRYPPLWGRLGIVEDNGFKVAVESTTTIQKPGHVPGSSFSASAGLVSKPNADRWHDLIETMNSKDQHTTA